MSFAITSPSSIGSSTVIFIIPRDSTRVIVSERCSHARQAAPIDSGAEFRISRQRSSSCAAVTRSAYWSKAASS
jgi:hypothetical protein